MTRVRGRSSQQPRTPQVSGQPTGQVPLGGQEQLQQSPDYQQGTGGPNINILDLALWVLPEGAPIEDRLYWAMFAREIQPWACQAATNFMSRFVRSSPALPIALHKC